MKSDKAFVVLGGFTLSLSFGLGGLYVVWSSGGAWYRVLVGILLVLWAMTIGYNTSNYGGGKS